jgi:hypothetical protein
LLISNATLAFQCQLSEKGWGAIRAGRTVWHKLCMRQFRKANLQCFRASRAR